MPCMSHPEIYGPVAWRMSGIDHPYYRLQWQQLFSGFHAIRDHSPQCKILSLTESCFSGGTIKFMQDKVLARFHALATWPLFLITTAGEEESSIAGFMQIFLDHVRSALTAEDAAAGGGGERGGGSSGGGSEGGEESASSAALPSLVSVFDAACVLYGEGNQGRLQFGRALLGNIAHTFGGESGVEEEPMSAFFGASPLSP